MLHQGRGSNFDHNNSLMYEQHEFVSTTTTFIQKKKCIPKEDCGNDIFNIYNE